MNFWARLWAVIGINLGVSFASDLSMTMTQVFGTSLLALIVVYAYARLIEAIEHDDDDAPDALNSR